MGVFLNLCTSTPQQHPHLRQHPYTCPAPWSTIQLSDALTQKHDLGPQGGEAVQGLHRMFLCSCAQMNAGSAVCSSMQTLGECCGQSLEGIVLCLAFNILGQNALRRVNREARRLSVIFPRWPAQACGGWGVTLTSIFGSCSKSLCYQEQGHAVLAA